jgi:hypothetical protein
MPRPLRNEQRTAEIGAGFLKCLHGGSLKMPRSSRRDIATGELAHFGQLRLWLRNLTKGDE